MNRSGAISVYLTGMIFGARVMSTQLIERLFHFQTKPRYKKIKADPRRGDAMTDDPLPQPADLFHRDGRGRSINWEYLVQQASLEEVSDYLWSFDSYARAQAMAMMMMRSCAKRCVQIFLDWGNMCDAPWSCRSYLAAALRRALAEVTLIELLEAAERTFYVGLPDFVPVWRGCERGRERGLSWTTDRAIAEGFARGKRCVNKYPTLACAEIPKRYIFGVFLSRQESELALDPRRLRKLRKEPLTPEDV